MGARRRLVLLFAGACGGLFGQVLRYVTGDESLFCHRVKVADTWEKNPHARTVQMEHPREPHRRRIP